MEKEFPGLEEALESVVRELRLEKQAVIAENADEGVEDIISYETAAVIARTADEARETYYRSWKQKALIPRSVCPFFTETAQTSKKA